MCVEDPFSQIWSHIWINIMLIVEVALIHVKMETFNLSF